MQTEKVYLVAILRQALSDLIAGSPDAARWFTRDGQRHGGFTFVEVCDYLDIEPDAFLRRTTDHAVDVIAGLDGWLDAYRRNGDSDAPRPGRAYLPASRRRLPSLDEQESAMTFDSDGERVADLDYWQDYDRYVAAGRRAQDEATARRRAGGEPLADTSTRVQSLRRMRTRLDRHVR